IATQNWECQNLRYIIRVDFSDRGLYPLIVTRSRLDEADPLFCPFNSSLPPVVALDGTQNLNTARNPFVKEPPRNLARSRLAAHSSGNLMDFIPFHALRGVVWFQG